MRFLASIGLTAVACLLCGTGCRSAVSDFYQDLTKGGGASGGTGGTGGLPMECAGDPTADPSLVRDECGVFVDSSVATSGDGSKASPFKTLVEAVATNKLRIFVCAGEYTEAVTVKLPEGASVYGGFASCPPAGDWAWDAAARATVTGPASSPAFHVSMGASLIQSMNIVAPAATLPGASSIALVADSTDLSLVNVDIETGDGAAGENGITPPEAPNPGAAGSSGTDACALQPVTGDPGINDMCEDGDSVGGIGGVGGPVPANNGDPGTDGSPAPDPNPDSYGVGGTVKADGTCSVGEIGKDGTDGLAGKGGTGSGTLTVNGISGSSGEDGKTGTRGQGGGGGAGSKAGTFCTQLMMTIAGPGASGGGGGAGGCGGKGGTGGKAGGSSIGIVSLGSTFSFSGVLIRTGAGGQGGAGGDAQAGANGGTGAMGGASSGLAGSKPGCAGGAGGLGGAGGKGGGGRGGHSLGIAFTGPAPETVGATFELGAAGEGGLGDAASMGDGAAGAGADTLEF